MTIEEFNSMLFQKKRKLMLHWWHYYGKGIYSYNELEIFEDLLAINIDQVIDIAVANFIAGEGPTPLLIAIRQNIVPQLISYLPNIDDFSEEEKEGYNRIKTGFINEIIATSGLDFSSGRK